jgi:hypothetical protein
MINSLRKGHRNLWLLLAVSVSTLITLAILSNPAQVKEVALEVTTDSVAPIIKEHQTANFKINLRGSAGNVELLELVLISPLKMASAQLSLMYKDGSLKTLGQIGATGAYRFKVDNDIEDWAAISLFDYIKNQEITNIKVSF